MINKDFRFRTEQKPVQDRHPAMRWLVFATSSVVIGAVIASTTSVSTDEDTINTDKLNREIQSIALDLETTNSNSQVDPKMADTQTFTRSAPKTNTIPLDLHTQQERIARQSFELPLPELQAQQEILNNLSDVDPLQWREYKIRSGDSLATLFTRAKLKQSQLVEMMKSKVAAKKLRHIYPGDVIRVLTNQQGDLVALRYEIDHKSYLMVERKDGQLQTKLHDYEIERRTTHASGEIKSSLYLAAQKAGISQNIIMELASIFGWDIDFALDIRKGDRFTLIYEELFRNGEKISDGNILTAEFINNKKSYRAVRYTNPQTNRAEYYTTDGKSMRKAFLRSPVEFTRISSRFSNSRYHPVLHKFRSHKGVDYAAKRGTPIRAAGDGKVIFKGRKGGYGRVIMIQHGSKYTSVYAHLNSYKRKIRVGKKVTQGQTIAYVGSSGLATGPHLHYELRVNGVHRNPLTIRLPSAQPVPKRYRLDFENTTKPLFAQLDLLSRTQLALNDI